jgi:hypothetical protein
MYLLQLVMPSVVFMLYGLNTIFGNPRIELFMVIAWGMFLTSVAHAACLYILPGSVITLVLHYIVLGLLTLGALWNFYVCIGQITQERWLAVRNFIMLICALVAIYGLQR